METFTKLFGSLDAVLADAGHHLIESEHPQPFGDHARGALLAVRECRMHMEVAALLDQLVVERFGGTRDLLFAGLCYANGGHDGEGEY